MDNRYRIWNLTKGEWFYVWAEVAPTEDPRYPSDEIDHNSTVIIEREDITKSFVQVNTTIGADLTTTNFELPLDEETIVQSGTGLTVTPSNVIIKDPGIYEVEYSVCGQMQGSTAGNRRRALKVELNKNNGTFVQATRTGGYTRTVSTGNICHASCSYMVTTSLTNETIGLRTEDLSQQSIQGITFTVQGGYLKIKRVG